MLSSSIISLSPECSDALNEEGFGYIPLIEMGGTVDGCEAAAAMTLGASGICMVTRFLEIPEAVIAKDNQKAVFKARDGGVNTARTTIYY